MKITRILSLRPGLFFFGLALASIATAQVAPTIVIPPSDTVAALGYDVALGVGAVGTAPLSYAWYKGGTLVPNGADGVPERLTISAAQLTDAGTYTVVVSNAYGSVTSSAATLTVINGLAITTQPQGGVVLFGNSVALSVVVTGDGPITYQWMLNGTAVSGATSATYNVTTAGTYTVVVTNPAGSLTSNAVSVLAGGRLINISSRVQVGTGAGIAFGGLIITNPTGGKKRVLLRSVGPTLAQFGLTGLLAQPILALYDAGGKVLAINGGWGTGPDATLVAQSAASIGAFPLPIGSTDSALMADLAPGNYTVQVVGQGGSTGLTLVEAYEVGADTSQFINLSVRGQVGTGPNILITGLVVSGSAPAKVLVRAVGPGLIPLGVAGALTQPVLTVYDSANKVVGSNTGWGTNPDAALLASTAAAVGTFALAKGSVDSALLLTLPPGVYTAQISGVGASTGIALVEVYLVP